MRETIIFMSINKRLEKSLAFIEGKRLLDGAVYEENRTPPFAC